MFEFKIRPLQPADLEQVSGIERSNAGARRKPFFEKYLAQAAANPEGFITCGVEDKGILQGFAFARIREGDFGSTNTVVVLDSLGIAPQFKGKGMGKTIIAEIERQMKAKRIGTLKTQTIWTDRAMTGFFSATGFELAPSRVLEKDLSNLALETVEDTETRDRIRVRSFMKEDFSSIVRIDAKHTGKDRTAYYEAKCREMLDESGIRMSVVADEAGLVVGFMMARVDLGEFGSVETQAVLDSIGVHPAYAGTGVGHALLAQLLVNLSTLKVDSVRTQASWEDFKLQRFLLKYGFGPSQRLVLIKTVN